MKSNLNGHYFLTIGFDWSDIFEILKIKEKISDFRVSEKYEYTSPNACSTEYRGINLDGAIFEYYIMPNVIKNGNLFDCAYDSIIYDQQLKRFFETPNINYGHVLYNSKNNHNLTCHFGKGMEDGYIGFAITYNADADSKCIVFMCDKKLINKSNISKRWGEKIPFRTFIIPPRKEISELPVVNEIEFKESVFFTSLQSADDAGVNPFSGIIDYLDKNKK